MTVHFVNISFSGIKIRSMSNVDLLEGDTIKLKCSVKLKSSSQLHLFEKDRFPFEIQVILYYKLIYFGERSY